MKPTIDVEKFIEYGIKASSGHNTQPWLLAVNMTERLETTISEGSRYHEKVNVVRLVLESLKN